MLRKFSRLRAVWLFALVAWLLLPHVIAGFNYPLGLISFLFYQLYHAPLGLWMTEPFFRPDSEIVFAVLPAGQILIAVFYLCVFGLLGVAIKARRRTIEHP